MLRHQSKFHPVPFNVCLGTIKKMWTLRQTAAVVLLLTTHPDLASPAYPRPYFTAVAWQAVADHLLPDWQLTAALFPYAHFSCNNAYSSPHRDTKLAELLFFPFVGNYFLVLKIFLMSCLFDLTGRETELGSQLKGTQGDSVWKRWISNFKDKTKTKHHTTQYIGSFNGIDI